MPATVTSIRPRRSTGAAGTTATPSRPFRDNPRLILAGIAVLGCALVALLVAANRTPRLAPDFLSEFVLYGVTAADLTMLAALLFGTSLIVTTLCALGVGDRISRLARRMLRRR